MFFIGEGGSVSCLPRLRWTWLKGCGPMAEAA
jgi:hypothetical protein